MIFVVYFPCRTAAFSLFPGFKDKGYHFSKIIATLSITYIIFLLTSLKMICFSRSLIICMAVVVGGLLFWWGQSGIKGILTKKLLRVWIFEELLFLTALLAWALLRGMEPSLNSLEKSMDFGFVNAILRADTMPPCDMWFAGKTINYYYFGHFQAAVMTALSGFSPAVCYNLLIATIFAQVLTFGFSLGGNLISLKKSRITSFPSFFIAGGISSFLLTFGGNLHPAFKASQNILNNGFSRIFSNYWFANATRFIGYDPPTSDQVIHEFPAYSFIVADLHAHMLNLPVVLLFFAVLLHFVCWQTDRDFTKATSILYLPVKQITGFGFLFAVFFMTNAWDVLNFGLLLFLVLCLVLKPMHSSGIKSFSGIKWFRHVIIAGISGLAVLIPAFLFALSFSKNFTPFSQGLEWTDHKSPIWQLFILHGGFWIIASLYLLSLVLRKKQNQSYLEKIDLFVLACFLTSLLLIAIPEVIVIKDALPQISRRANTMFKLTYSAHIISSITAGFMILSTIWHLTGSILKKPAIALLALVFCLLSIFPFLGIPQFYNFGQFQTLNGFHYLKWGPLGSIEAIQWLNTTIKGAPVIVEAPGKSYSLYNHISSATGLPSVLGWQNHAILWHNNEQIVIERLDHIHQIYTSDDPKKVRQLIKYYNISYIIVGKLEQDDFGPIDEQRFTTLGILAFKAGDTRIYKVDTPSSNPDR
ncbi:MAG: DUF2298 domain-containing protein [Desulfobacula sp.]|uniref:DUF2298 domain-containing protein n=1 Tax=Desulfobacula sp. TaxID=2593537 RepID=UPI0025B9792F|nr:DUF2298 domain-containing protein [Desulfobacula sp.]MCD4721409.1 DUF2298 domain-containing protein [Desulfobacula sp.]